MLWRTTTRNGGELFSDGNGWGMGWGGGGGDCGALYVKGNNILRYGDGDGFGITADDGGYSDGDGGGDGARGNI